ncbi:MAG: hypothetical protein ABL911_01225 [Gallionella sp.]|nr:hypothetical protein [Gallionella sp.]
MAENHYAQDITSENLRLFLEFWPKFSAEADEAHQMFIEVKDKLLNDDTEPFSWCYLYELPFRQHMIHAISAIVQGYNGLISVELVSDWYKQVANTPGQIGALPGVHSQIGQHFDNTELSDEHSENLLPNIAGIYGLGLSMHYSLSCVLYHGCFLNELIERIRDGDDKALFDAVRIDPTIIGCISVSFRISKAALLQDNSFFAKLKAAISGKMAKREQANFQKMRLVFEVLHEAGATRLNDFQLQQLFVQELGLYASNAKGGGNTKALRKFADTYMKKSSTT